MKKDNTLKERGLTEDILSKLVIENDESNQSSILGTIYMSKSRLLVIQTKIWNDKPYWDFRVWYKKDDEYFRPGKQGFMLASDHDKGDGTHTYPVVDFFNVIKSIANFPNEEEAGKLAEESGKLTTKMLQGIVDRDSNLTQQQIDRSNKRVVNQFIHNPLDNEFVSP